MENYLIEKTPRTVDGSKDKYVVFLLDLWRRNLRNSSLERLHWLYCDKPICNAQSWIAYEQKKMLPIATAGMLFREIKVGDCLCIAGISIDFAVDKEYRVFGPALALQKALCDHLTSNGLRYQFAFPNQSGYGVFKRIGYVEVGNVPYWSKLLDVDSKVKRIFPNKVLRGFFASIINSCFATADKIYGYFVQRGFRLEIITNPDIRFDDLWLKASRKFPVTFKRDFSYLRWRYASCPSAQYKFFCCLDNKTKKLMGYLVVTVSSKIATIEDFLFIDDRALEFLLSALVRHGRIQKVSSILCSFLGSAKIERIFQKLLFVRRKSGRYWLMYDVKRNESECDGAFLQSSQWLLCDGDMDL